MRIATQSFIAEVDGERIEIVAGVDRVAPDHPIATKYPQHFRSRGLEEELQIRSERVDDLASRDFSASGSTPVSRAGRAERDAANFWTRVQRDLDRTAPDLPTSAERAEQEFFDTAIVQLEESGTRELAEANAEAERAYGFDRGGWNRRMAD
jgi:hypothetical protein